MRANGLEPEFPAEALAAADDPAPARDGSLRDLRHLPWCSIDNAESRDLDQLQVCEPQQGFTRVFVAIADVDALVPPGGPVDAHARVNTTSVYTVARVFPMLPESLSTDRTSLLPGADRQAVVVQMDIDDAGHVRSADVFPAHVRNSARLVYEQVGAWLDGSATSPAREKDSETLREQLRLQDRVATLLRGRRREKGALDFEHSEVQPVLEGDEIRELRESAGGRARDLIEDFMIAVNGASARFLSERGVPGLRRVVRTPDRWPRIVKLATEAGTELPPEPDARALEAFLAHARATAPDRYGELSLSVIKLLGRGEYAVDGASGADGHFALAVSEYTHSTAPNRRYPDLITQRLLKAVVRGARPPFSREELEWLAAHCTRQEDAANKVERQVKKAASALWLSSRIGEHFDAVVTGASSKGTWVRTRRPTVEGKLEEGFEGLDIGDRVRVRLIGTDPTRGFIDFARA